MKLITGLTQAAKQRHIVPVDDGSNFTLIMEYMPRQNSWKMGIEYGEFKAYGIAMVMHPNILKSFINAVPFGILIQSQDGADPHYIDDFISGRVSVYVLDSSDVLFVDEEILQ